MLADVLKRYSLEMAWAAAFLFLCNLVCWRLFAARRRDGGGHVGSGRKSKGEGFYGDADVKTVDFSNVQPYKPDFDYAAEEPEKWWLDDYISDRVYTATMASPFDDWIRIDRNYPRRMAHKTAVFSAAGTSALDHRDGSHAPCAELLAMLVEYLPRRFPTVFAPSPDGRRMANRVTGDVFEVRAPYGGLHPLEIVGRLTEEDLAVLVPPPPPGEDEKEEEEEAEYVLKAVVSAFPAGFDIKDKIDKPLTAIHTPVPTYKEKLQKAMNKFFKNVSASRLVMRVNWSINDREQLFLLDGGHLYEDDSGAAADESIDVEQVQLRVERQVLRRLPQSGAMCMMTKTYLYRLADIATHPGFAARLGGLLHKLPEKFAFYKRKPVWGKVVLAYLDEMAAKHPALPAGEGA